MTETLIIISCIVGAYLIIRLFTSPIRLIFKLTLSVALGFLALWLVQIFSPFTGFSLGMNLGNALCIGIFGLPGLALLLVLRWLFT